MLSKKLRIGVSACACVLLLASCDELIAKPNDYETPIVDVNETIVNNMESVIYDALHSADDFKTSVVNVVFEKIFVSYFGTYANIEEAVAAKGQKLYDLIDKHKVYQEIDENGKRDTSSIAQALELARPARVYNEMQRLISETLFSALNSSTFKEDNLFQEKLFALSIYKKLHVLDANKSFEDLEFYDDVFIAPDTVLFDVETNQWLNQKIIHLEYYKEYIKSDIIPSVMQSILIENYLVKNEYASLGRKYARKVNYVSIAENTAFPGAAKLLCDAFINNNLNSPTATEADKDLSILADARKGITAESATDEHKAKVQALLASSGLEIKHKTKANFEALKGNDVLEDIDYYEGTAYGDVIISFEKIKDNIALTNKESESIFSGSGSYGYRHGLDLKTNEVILKDYTTDGWGTKTDGFTGLPSDIRTRLFNISISTDVNTSAKPAEQTSTDWVKNINGKYYLLPKTYEQGNDRAFLIYDSATYYIVEIEEAASTSRLSTNGVQSSYTKLRNDYGAYAEEVAYKIASTLVTNSSSKTNALEHYLDESGILYHDQSIYDYFKKTYPAIFED